MNNNYHLLKSNEYTISLKNIKE